MDQSIRQAQSRVAARFGEIASSNLTQSDKTFLERLTMQGGIDRWSDGDKRKYTRVAQAFLKNFPEVGADGWRKN